MRTVAIVGTGLIGASFGLALKRAGFDGEILGVSSQAALRAALDCGAVDRGAELAEAAGAADLLYLAQPIGRILDTLRHLPSLLRRDSLVTDAGSTKQAIVTLAEQVLPPGRFLGGHPMAGKEQRGASAAEAGLFAGRTYVLTPGDPEDLDRPAGRCFADWLVRIGARVVVLDAAEHDRIVAFTSHLPQLASTGLAATIAERIPRPGDLAVAGPGLIDSTRLALSSYELWRDILATNTGPVEQALTAYIQKLEDLRENLRTRRLEEEFRRAADLASHLRR